MTTTIRMRRRPRWRRLLRLPRVWWRLYRTLRKSHTRTHAARAAWTLAWRGA